MTVIAVSPAMTVIVFCFARDVILVFLHMPQIFSALSFQKCFVIKTHLESSICNFKNKKPPVGACSLQAPRRPRHFLLFQILYNGARVWSVLEAPFQDLLRN